MAAGFDEHFAPDALDRNFFVPDILVPSQWAALHLSTDLTPERLLLMRILDDAIEVWQKYHVPRLPVVDTRSARHRRLWEEADAWIFARRGGSYITFEFICDHFSLLPETLREGLLRWVANPARTPGKRMRQTAGHQACLKQVVHPREEN
jgi:hypothetical protein